MYIPSTPATLGQYTSTRSTGSEDVLHIVVQRNSQMQRTSKTVSPGHFYSNNYIYSAIIYSINATVLVISILIIIYIMLLYILYSIFYKWSRSVISPSLRDVSTHVSWACRAACMQRVIWMVAIPAFAK